MSFTFLLGVLLTGSQVVADDTNRLVTGNMASAGAWHVAPDQPQASATDAVSATTSIINCASGTMTTNTLPPLPSGVSELKFSEFFRQPIGPRGLEYTERLRRLGGRRIRILGYMVRQEQPVDHGFLLSPVPLTLHENEYGLADDLPVTALRVFTTEDLPARIPHTPGPMLLTGKLSLGNRLEADGRTSTVRLHLDPPTPEQKAAALAAANYKTGSDAHAGHGP